jgi:transposase
MAVADGNGFPIAVAIADGTRGEAGLVEETLDQRFTKRCPKRLIGDKAYDSTKLEATLKTRRIELISPQIRTRADHKRSATRRRQDGRPLRRYRKRWKVERLWAWLLRYRRITTRYEAKAANFLALLHIACAHILLRRLEGL